MIFFVTAVFWLYIHLFADKLLLVSSFQAILLSDSSSDEEDEDAVISEAELQNMLRLHKYQRKHQMQFYQDPEVSYGLSW